MAPHALIDLPIRRPWKRRRRIESDRDPNARNKAWSKYVLRRNGDQLVVALPMATPVMETWVIFPQTIGSLGFQFFPPFFNNCLHNRNLSIDLILCSYALPNLRGEGCLFNFLRDPCGIQETSTLIPFGVFILFIFFLYLFFFLIDWSPSNTVASMNPPWCSGTFLPWTITLWTDFLILFLYLIWFLDWSWTHNFLPLHLLLWSQVLWYSQ